MKIKISVPKRYVKTEVELIKVPPKKRQKGIKMEIIL